MAGSNRSIGTVERAFELAAQSATIEEVRQKLKREGYSQVEEHLSGCAIRSDLKKVLKSAPSSEAVGPKSAAPVSGWSASEGDEQIDAAETSVSSKL